MKIPAVALGVLMCLDLFTTWLGLAAGAAEKNPVGVALLGSGFGSLVVAKAVGTAIILAVACWLHRQTEANRLQAIVALRLCCTLMLVVVAWNSVVVWLRTT